jgi:hypothetical protein
MLTTVRTDALAVLILTLGITVSMHSMSCARGADDLIVVDPG